jgi:hypothetical protein
MTQQEIDALFNSNVLEINKMDISSGSMIKELIMEMESNGPAYIRLNNADEGGHKISYTHVEGDRTLTGRVGNSLGIIVTADRLEVPHA